MPLFLYVVFDLVAAATAGPLLAFPNDAVARRAFQDTIAGNTGLSDHPDDYELRRVGSFDRVSGVVTPSDHEVVITGSVIAELLNRSSSRPE